ncbi:MAG TPA: response regulator transcription factor [Chitinophagaceae bacterium]
MSGNKKIAIVDDHVMVRKGLCALIGMFPSYEILFDASNGKEMIEKLKNQVVPDIVLLDINMPEMDGYETARWLKNHYPEVIVLALSTMDSETAIIKMIRNGAKGYILKDSDPNVLKEAFDTAVKNGYYYNEVITHKLVNSLTNPASASNGSSSTELISQREREFLELACSEKTYQQIAKEMLVSERTVDGYRDALFKKLQVSTRVGMVIFAFKNKLVHI